MGSHNLDRATGVESILRIVNGILMHQIHDRIACGLPQEIAIVGRFIRERPVAVGIVCVAALTVRVPGFDVDLHSKHKWCLERLTNVRREADERVIVGEIDHRIRFVVVGRQAVQMKGEISLSDDCHWASGEQQRDEQEHDVGCQYKPDQFDMFATRSRYVLYAFFCVKSCI